MKVGPPRPFTLQLKCLQSRPKRRPGRADLLRDLRNRKKRNRRRKTPLKRLTLRWNAKSSFALHQSKIRGKRRSRKKPKRLVPRRRRQSHLSRTTNQKAISRYTS